jgi:hypothetical protein
MPQSRRVAAFCVVWIVRALSSCRDLSRFFFIDCQECIFFHVSRSMTLRVTLFWIISCLSLIASTPVNFEKNETLVLLGDTFFERDYRQAHLETALTLATAGKKLRIRNLGWSGDTPRCESRSYFGPPAEGFERLRKQLAEIKPTTVICCYGAVDSFQGEAGVVPFIASYERLIEMIASSCAAKVILMTPPAVSRDAKRFPALSAHGAELERYATAIQRLADTKSLGFADLLGQMKQRDWQTINGVTFTDDDYSVVAPLFVKSLGLSLPNGNKHPSLRETIVAKNHLFFQRWRPQNEIYLFGSRKHEQGRNGAEIPQFDPLIAEKEQLIFGTFPHP